MNPSFKLKLVRLGCAGSVLLFSLLIAIALWVTRPRVETQPPAEPVLQVDVLEAQPVSHRVRIESHGELRPLRQLTLSAQTTGDIKDLPRRLRPGDRVSEGELLVRLDDRDFELALAELRASRERLDTQLTLLRQQAERDEALLKLARKSKQLAENEFNRLERLAASNQAVSASEVEASERALNQARSEVIQLEQALALNPLQIRELEAEKQALAVRIDQQNLQISRTRIIAPFSGRVVRSSLEPDEYVQPGQPLLTLADDSELEVAVPVTAEDLRQWIQFAHGEWVPESGWFPPLEPVEAELFWTAGEKEVPAGTGHLHRILEFDPVTRTARVAVRVRPGASGSGAFPLTEGMFCRVRIPGVMLEDVFALPRYAVTFDNQAYLAVDGRLKTVEVTPVYSEADTVFVREGISESDRVIITRLVAPLEGRKLKEVPESP